MSIALKTETLKEALKDYTKELGLKLEGKKTTISFTPANKDLLEYLQEHLPSLTEAQKARISSWLFAGENIGEMEVKSANELYKKIAFFGGTGEPVLDIKVGGQWYPVMASVEKFKSMSGETIVIVSANATLGGLNYGQSLYVGPWDFEGDDDNDEVVLTVDEILAKKNMRVTSKEAVEASKLKQARMMEFRAEDNKVYDAWGTGLVFHNFWGWNEVNIGWADSPTTVVVEPTLENRYARHGEMAQTEWQLPLVRVFSFKHKDYVYVDIDTLQKHTFHRDGINKIVLPKKMLTALGSIFNSSQKNIFGDLFHGRHGGIVVLANGPSGVGKTLTAEVFAEYQERPLYTMEMGEIGTNVKEVEQNLQKIFARAKKWNAVLLFDEADIFLSERVASDLERSAIVGIFLRLLDYYEGTFFLTTNRGEGIDKAFKSRVTLYLDYPALSAETRRKIWDGMLKAASLNVTETDDVHFNWEAVVTTELNGRQIRNQVRLLKLMHIDGNLTTEDIVSSLEFTTR